LNSLRRMIDIQESSLADTGKEVGNN